MVVDDEQETCNLVERALQGLCRVYKACTAAAALEIVAKHEIDCVVLDQVLPDMDTLAFMGKLDECVWVPGVFILAVLPQSGQTMAALQRGAVGYLPKPATIEEIRAFAMRVVQKTLTEKRMVFMQKALEETTSVEIIGNSPAISGVKSLIANVAGADNCVLISGEHGTGKETVARAIHNAGPRRGSPFTAVRCSQKIGMECHRDLFGEEHPAAPGTSRRIGKFEYAAGGTIFIEDVEWLPMEAQESLLSIIQERRAVRIGGRNPFAIDARIIASTTVDLRESVKQGTFRQDLYWQLAVVNVHIPPLRERFEDLPALLEHFFSIHSCRHGRAVPRLDEESLKLLQSHEWQGNLDELDQVAQCLLRAVEGDTVRKENMPLEVLMASHVQALTDKGGEGGDGEDGALRQARMEFERLFILRVLDQCEGNQVKAAKVLGVHRNTLINKMNELSLREPGSKPRKSWLEADSGKA